MIDIKDLRIGNKVKCTISNDAAIYTVLAIPAWGMDGSGDGNNPLIIIDRCPKQLVTEKQLKPIPLSPEILEKCGFKNYGDAFEFQPELENVKYRIVDFHGWIFSKGFGEWNSEITIVKYLHELQNVFYAIQHQELNYTP